MRQPGSFAQRCALQCCEGDLDRVTAVAVGLIPAGADYLSEAVVGEAPAVDAVAVAADHHDLEIGLGGDGGAGIQHSLALDYVGPMQFEKIWHAAQQDKAA